MSRREIRRREIRRRATGHAGSIPQGSRSATRGIVRTARPAHGPRSDLLLSAGLSGPQRSQRRGGLQSGEMARIRGVVAEVDQRMAGSGTHILGVLVRCGEGCIRLLWFNQAYMRQRFSVGHEAAGDRQTEAQWRHVGVFPSARAVAGVRRGRAGRQTAARLSADGRAEPRPGASRDGSRRADVRRNARRSFPGRVSCRA